MSDVIDTIGSGNALPNIDITGFLSNTWIYVLIVAVIGFVLILGVALLIFFKVYNRRVVFFDNIAGLGYQPVLKKRARLLRLGSGGEELLGLVGGDTMSSYGRKMGKNTYWFAKGQDGYWYNFILGDLDTKLAMLDIEPVDKDVRMFHVAKDRINKENYLKRSFMEKYGVHILLFVFLVTLVLGMWFIVGKVGDATSALAATQDANRAVIETTNKILELNANMQNSGATSGLVPIS